ncbi:Pre-mRNA-splicing factor ISY1 [Scheffersomyces amazonensis]|uniref:Pre-mRNA-splicing factor ISY1 n=1 Tax=Scheffersomyces amazonensis TaxID=1078765 RepID=UPI00315D11E5
MSRNKEKAQSALNRFQALKNREAGVLESNPNLRPKYVQSVTSLAQAEKWRTTIISEISVKLTRISDQSINDYQIRDLNDDLNRLFKEKRSWEYHIKSLGGNDYINFGKNLDKAGVLDSTGLQVKGYRYFGRAKDLPDVKQALEQHKKLQHEKGKKGQDEESKIMKDRLTRIDISYYGIDDEINNNLNLFSQSEINLIEKVANNLGETITPPLRANDNLLYNKPDSLIEYENTKSASIEKNLKRKKTNQSPEETIYDFNSQVPNNEQVTKTS